MQANASKFQYILVMSYDKLPDINVLHIQDGVDLQSESCVKLLRVDIDQSLSFKDHLSKTCKKAARQLSRLSNILTVEAKLALVRGFLSHLKFYPTTWHFCSISDTKKNGKDPEKRFKICFCDYQSPYKDLLETAGVSMLYVDRSLATAMCEVYIR